MIKSVCSLLALLSYVNAVAQFTIKNVKDSSDMGSYVFPVLHSAQQPVLVFFMEFNLCFNFLLQRTRPFNSRLFR